MSLLDLLDRPIAFHRSFVTITGSVTAALFLSQTVYWSRRTHDASGWFFKSRDEWAEETGLTRFEQESARKSLKKLGLLEEKLEGLPAKLFFRLHESRLEQLLSSLVSIGGCFPANKPATFPPTGWLDNGQQVGGKPSGIYKEAKTTTETTTKREAPPLSSDTSADKSFTTSSDFQRNRYHEWIKSHWDSLQEEYLPYFNGNVVLLSRSLNNCISWSFDNPDRAKKFSNPGMRIRKWLDEEDVERLIRAQEGQERAAARVVNANPSFAWKDSSIHDSLPIVSDKSSDFLSLISEYKRLFSIFLVFAKDNLNFHLTNSDWIRFENDMMSNQQKYIDFGEPGFPAFYEFFEIRA